jgi:hypothetical protein
VFVKAMKKNNHIQAKNIEMRSTIDLSSLKEFLKNTLKR